MNVPTIQFEGRLFGYKKTRNKDGDWVEVRLQVHPEEAAPLNSIALGQRLQCVVVPIGNDEQPLPVKPKGGELAKRAGILCGDERFQKWLAKLEGHILTGGPKEKADATAILLRRMCGVLTRAEFDSITRTEPGQKFLALEHEFKEAHGMVAERTQ